MFVTTSKNKNKELSLIKKIKELSNNALKNGALLYRFFFLRPRNSDLLKMDLISRED
jgi:hypothetical protein